MPPLPGNMKVLYTYYYLKKHQSKQLTLLILLCFYYPYVYFFIHSFLFYVYECCLQVCLCTTFVHNPQIPEEGIQFPRTGVQVVVSCHRGARNRICLLHKSNQCFQLQLHCLQFLTLRPLFSSYAMGRRECMSEEEGPPILKKLLLEVSAH